MPQGPHEEPETPARSGGGPPSRPPSVEDDVGWAQWSAVGFEFAAAVLLFFFAGSWLDATWGTHPWMKVAGAGLGIVLGMYALISKALRANRTPSPKPPDSHRD